MPAGLLTGLIFPTTLVPSMDSTRISGSEYFNYKKYFSKLLGAIVDMDYRFIYFDLGAEGRALIC